MVTTEKTNRPVGPLAGLRVIDITQVMAGPFCTMMLGDMGADVIKIEPPDTGDQTRRSMKVRLKGTDSPGYLALNRNKRSLALDLKSEEDRRVLHRLVKTADILVENGRPGAMKKFGADYETLRAINPRLIYASISGFGQTGPWSDRPGFDLIAQAMTGVMSTTGEPSGPPGKCGIPVSDLGAALFATYGILSAVIGRSRSGVGQFLDISLFDAALALSIWETTEYFATGTAPERIGTGNRMGAPYQAFKASDGHFVVGAGNQRLWEKLCDVLQDDRLRGCPDFRTNADRMVNRDALAARLNDVFDKQPVSFWIDELLNAGIPAAPILTYAEALTTDHAKARNATMEISHPVEGQIKSLGFPVKLSGSPAAVYRHPPLLDEHRKEILDELNVGDSCA